VAPIAIVFGILLTVQGVVAYLTGDVNPETGHVSYTSLIPAGAGLLLLLLGLVALNEKLRMHAMHGAALVGVLGFLLAAGRAVMVLATKPAAEVNWTATTHLFIMAGLCLVFVALCVRSFIVARINRRKQQAA
jgi:hypothetical protein